MSLTLILILEILIYVEPINPTQPLHPLETPITSPPQKLVGNHKKYLFVSVLILIFLLVTASIGYFLGKQNNTTPGKKGENKLAITTPINPSSTREPDPTPDNKLKTFQGQSFSFQYPKDWTVTKSDNASVSLQKTDWIIPDGGTSTQPENTVLTIYSTNIQPAMNLDQWLENRYLFNGDKNLFDLTKQYSKKTSLEGAEAISVEVPGAGGYIYNGTVSIYNGKGYDISILGVHNPANLDAYQGILTSFKFID